MRYRLSYYATCKSGGEFRLPRQAADPFHFSTKQLCTVCSPPWQRASSLTTKITVLSTTLHRSAELLPRRPLRFEWQELCVCHSPVRQGLNLVLIIGSENQ